MPLQGTLEGGVMVYTVPVSLTGAEKLALRVGMTANVEIKVADITDALLLPTIALQQSNGQYQVLVPTTADPNGATQAVTVEVGLSDGTYTQILKGLSVGDKVVEQVKSTTSDSNQQMGGRAAWTWAAVRRLRLRRAAPDRGNNDAIIVSLRGR